MAGITELTSEIVAAYVRHNPVPLLEVSTLIGSVHGAFSGLAKQSGAPILETDPAPKPAVPIRRSVSDDHLVCLECGGLFKTLKRHLSTSHQKTPAQYREDWKLKATYPMIAASFAAKRSRLAKELGLGTPKRKRLVSGPRVEEKIRARVRRRSLVDA